MPPKREYTTIQGSAGKPTSDKADVSYAPSDEIKQYLTPDQFKPLPIWRRFLASQMADAVFRYGSGEISRRKNTSSGERADRKFSGFLGGLRVQETRKMGKRISGVLPELTEQEILDLIKLLPGQHFTEPPPRVQRGEPDQGARRERHRPPLDVRPHHKHHYGQELCQAGDARFFPTKLWHRRQRCFKETLLRNSRPEIHGFDRRGAGRGGREQDTWTQVVSEF